MLQLVILFEGTLIRQSEINAMPMQQRKTRQRNAKVDANMSSLKKIGLLVTNE